MILPDEREKEINELIKNDTPPQDVIKHILKIFENEFNITVLYAVESGSRAYGFHDDDSDYDVRFIYMKRLKDYVSIDNRLESMDWFDNTHRYDFVGYDLKKAVKLCRKSNPTIYEMMKCDLKYVETNLFSRDDFSLVKLYNHYKGMVNAHFKRYRRDSMTQKDRKHYLYMLRAYLQAKHIEKQGTLPPVDINILLRKIHGNTRNFCNMLINGELLNDDELYTLNNIFSDFINTPSKKLNVQENKMYLTRRNSNYFNALFQYYVFENPSEIRIAWNTLYDERLN